MIRLAHILVCHSTNPTKAIESIPHRAGDLWFVFLHSMNSDVEQSVDRLIGERDGNIFSYKTNRGLAKSWNEGLHLAQQSGCDASLLLNDDLFFYKGKYLEFVQTIEAVRRLSRNVSYVTMLGLETGSSPHSGQVLPQSFACCAIFPETIEKIGYFDENFSPAYYEDIDYDRRAALAGMTIHVHNEILVEHERSSTRKALSNEQMTQADASFIANKEYFHRKWGAETSYTSPFGQADLSVKIPFRSRRRPYANI